MTRDASLYEMLSAMSHYKDDEIFRWFQDSEVSKITGKTVPTELLRLTFGQVRAEVAFPDEHW